MLDKDLMSELMVGHKRIRNEGMSEIVKALNNVSRFRFISVTIILVVAVWMLIKTYVKAPLLVLKWLLLRGTGTLTALAYQAYYVADMTLFWFQVSRAAFEEKKNNDQKPG